MPAISKQPSHRRTRIIATLGPATNDQNSVTRLIESGVNLIRLNMSHGSHADHEKSFKLVRHVASRLGRDVAIFCDLCGPKIRVGKLANGSIQLRARSEVVITTRSKPRDPGVIPCQYAALHKDVGEGHRILLDDGKLELKVLRIDGRDVHCRVVYGGVLKDNKGINLPDSQVSSSSLTANDRRDVLFAIKMGADFIALSFVRTVDDITKLRRYMRRQGSELPIIAKIEKPEALDNFDAILRESYAIMIARGDLGIEIDAARVPMVQNDLIKRARRACKPVIVATQMMESMITESRPTRAEVGDVSNAALIGADAVMLSGETSVGKYPIQAVRYMAHILEQLESWQRDNRDSRDDIDMRIKHSPRRALANAAIEIAEDLELLGLFIPTTSGATVGVVSAFRPSTPVYGICNDARSARALMLHWGVIPIVIETHDTSDWAEMTRRVARRLNLRLKGKSVAVLAGFGRRSDNNQPVIKMLHF